MSAPRWAPAFSRAMLIIFVNRLSKLNSLEKASDAFLIDLKSNEKTVFVKLEPVIDPELVNDPESVLVIVDEPRDRPRLPVLYMYALWIMALYCSFMSSTLGLQPHFS